MRKVYGVAGESFWKVNTFFGRSSAATCSSGDLRGRNSESHNLGGNRKIREGVERRGNRLRQGWPQQGAQKTGRISLVENNGNDRGKKDAVRGNLLLTRSILLKIIFQKASYRRDPAKLKGEKKKKILKKESEPHCCREKGCRIRKKNQAFWRVYTGRPGKEGNADTGARTGERRRTTKEEFDTRHRALKKSEGGTVQERVEQLSV